MFLIMLIKKGGGFHLVLAHLLVIFIFEKTLEFEDLGMRLLNRLEALPTSGSASVGDVARVVEVSIAEVKHVWARVILEWVVLGEGDTKMGGLNPVF